MSTETSKGPALVYTWNGKRIEELSAEELREALIYSMNEIDALNRYRQATTPFVDWLAYLARRS